MKLKNPIMLALDVDTDQHAMQILDQVQDSVGAIKIGPRLNLRYGAAFIEKVKDFAPVFVDNKYFDITSTVLAAVQASFDAGASFATVHALNGADTLHKLSILEQHLNQTRPFKILAVTVLTSWSQVNFTENFKPWSVHEHVVSMAKMAEQSGITGLVCSGHELALIQKHNLFKVVPGIRIEEDLKENTQDQKRVMTPKQAIDAGASGLVIGRSILNSKSPRDTVKRILESIHS